MKKNNSNFTWCLIVVYGVFFMSFLASCSTSTQMASSFGKRKYMPGHFYDRVEPVKTRLAAGRVPITAMEVNNHQKVEISFSYPSSFAVANAKIVSVKNEQITSKALQKPFMQPLIAGPSVAKINSLPATVASGIITSIQEDNGYEVHHFGRRAFSFLILALVFGLLAFLFVFNPGLLLVFEVVAYICFALFVVFLILWLISLAA